MKVFADFSVLLKIAVVCPVIGFILGPCATGTTWFSRSGPAPAVPAPSVSAR
ncbi:hypothetical protein C8E87_6973 [Paractinoplanes brasiliensis]|uniref:Uncharacterized protein n=1 Tax=Paractinoplanes brasiliensis TaxID=52695 RepID=A0A4R6J8R0_9ACTN|nr:hypothetical protein C8E87_6973 [Actinoplanes brasiliensis]